MIIERRVFRAKPGQAGSVVAIGKEIQNIFESNGWPEGRMLTDYLSGDTDRVVWEFEVENLAALEVLQARLGQMPPEVGGAIERMMGLIDGAYVEHWKIES